ncbi:glycosyltransferase family 4 protein [Aeromonas sp. PrichA-15]|uniref:glycosyltransferase family 4 protein n=1 Tax=Aeromonas sp. PrichA-15 TaxID=2823360 RepID=UPI001B33C4CB|nr:glycosyltransferase family 4 protein [Aeromonas sp. PrichA-15]MBP4033169.1 glycosyltransferase family 4 protein [Aeromonas sp. PrichA-15]
MKRICFFIGDLNNSGGTERVSSVIASELQHRGYQVHMLSLQCGNQPFFELADGIHISQLFTTAGRGMLRLPLAIGKLRRYLQQHHIDILIDVESMLALYALPAVLGLNIRHICWEHFNYNVDLGKASRRLARKLAARFADDVITLTERDKQLWLANTTCKAHITAIPNPVTIALPTNINPEKEKLFLAVGRLTYQKGFDLLLQAWAQVAPLHPDWRLRIVGDGEDRTMLEQLRRKLNIEASTELVPKTNNIAAHYQQAAFFVMSSRFEGLPLVLIEAQAYGLPIVSFDCDTGPAEIIKHGETGWLCKPGCIESLSSSINVALQYTIDANDLTQLCSSAVKNVEKFTLPIIAARWCELFENR